MEMLEWLEKVYGKNGYTASAVQLGDNRYSIEFTNGETTDSILVEAVTKNGHHKINRVFH
jgi:hypothetical protein